MNKYEVHESSLRTIKEALDNTTIAFIGIGREYQDNLSNEDRLDFYGYVVKKISDICRDNGYTALEGHFGESMKTIYYKCAFAINPDSSKTVTELWQEDQKKLFPNGRKVEKVFDQSGNVKGFDVEAI